MLDLSCRHLVCCNILQIAVTVMQDVRQRTRIELAPRQQGANERMYTMSTLHYHVVVRLLPNVS
jgi:hypothetical protein